MRRRVLRVAACVRACLCVCASVCELNNCRLVFTPPVVAAFVRFRRSIPVPDFSSPIPRDHRTRGALSRTLSLCRPWRRRPVRGRVEQRSGSGRLAAAAGHETVVVHRDGGRAALRRVQATVQQPGAVAVLPRAVPELRGARATAAAGAAVRRGAAAGEQRQLDDQQHRQWQHHVVRLL